jgi:hypothetical protein
MRASQRIFVGNCVPKGIKVKPEVVLVEEAKKYIGKLNFKFVQKEERFDDIVS